MINLNKIKSFRINTDDYYPYYRILVNLKIKEATCFEYVYENFESIEMRAFLSPHTKYKSPIRKVAFDLAYMEPPL